MKRRLRPRKSLAKYAAIDLIRELERRLLSAPAPESADVGHDAYAKEALAAAGFVRPGVQG